MRTRVKICCIGSSDEAAMAIAAGADALGLVGDMPSGAGVIDDDTARAIAAATPPPIGTFLLTSRVTADDIIAHASYCGTGTVQIVSHVDPGEYPAIAAARPNLRLVQVIHVEDGSALELIPRYAAHVHAFLLDSGRPSAPIAELGGTGRVHDWNISAAFVARSPRPVFLAGGLRPDNVAEAIARVRPFGLDLCTGVRTDGALDPRKLAAFMADVADAQPVARA